MPMETYRLEVRETETAEGIDVDLYGEDDLVEASTRVAYEEFGLEPADDRETPTAEFREFRADAMRTDVQFARDPAGFDFRVVGDGDGIETVRIEDEAWDLDDS
ncbi:hypothetical protein [Saliphagus infecundisoli]|uniref:Halobacterial output domain-containing protein n=1 Tax=Saliphagus infecundisoli TaxID=1849069 RepID=A0ABD5QJ99_9EURY|nr:hypothetical protein [Saliphagus infecundisoli]